MSTFFTRNEIISEDIQKYQNIIFLHLLFYTANQWRNKRFEPGW